MIKDNRFNRRLTSLLFLTTLFFSTVPINVLADSDETRYYSVTDGLNYQIETTVLSSWQGHSNVELKIKNTGSNKIDNWHITFSTPCAIENIWNANIIESDGRGTYTIRNNYYNQDIEVAGEVTIGMTIDSEEISDISSWYLLNTKKIEVENDKYLIDYQEYSNWSSGFNGALFLNSYEEIEDWSLSFDSEYKITTVSNAILELCDDGTYLIKNDGNLQNINTNLILGIQGFSSDNGFALSNIKMTSVCLGLSLGEDTDNNGIPDYQDLVMTQDEINPVTPTNAVTPTVTLNPTIVPTTTLVPTITPEVTSVPTEILDYELDSDEDGLPDFYELEIGTDINVKDTDDDHISDYDEVLIGYNPTENDSDVDGIFDGDEDFDEDGLTNSVETDLGTLLYLKDSDLDDLEDYDEIYVYSTDPTDYDTDDDDLCDGDEVKIGKNPSDPSDSAVKVLQTKEEDIANKEEPFLNKVEVSIELSSVIDYSLKIEDLSNRDVVLTNINARIGCPIRFECSEEFDKAAVTFYYDDSCLGDTNENDLILLWCDSDTGIFVEQEQAVLDVENNTLSVELNHFSDYMVVDGKIWYAPIDFPDYDYEFNNSANLDLFISLEDIDDLTQDERETAAEIAYKIIDDSKEGDRIGVIITHSNGIGDPYSTYTTYLRQTEPEKQGLKLYIENNYVKTEEHYGSDAYINNAIKYSILVSQNSGDIGNAKRILQITNGRAEHYFSPLFSSQGYVMKEQNVPFYAIDYSAQEPAEDYWLYGWCTFTKGAYKLYRNSDISTLIDEIRGETDRALDKDNDGLPDYLEDQGMVCINYTDENGSNIIYTDSSVANGYSTDEDSLSDREEMGILYEIKRHDDNEITIYKDEKPLVTYANTIPDGYYKMFRKYAPETKGQSNYVFSIKSNPTVADSDYDNYLDDIDAIPQEPNRPVNVVICGLDSNQGAGTPIKDAYEAYCKSYMDGIYNLKYTQIDNVIDFSIFVAHALTDDNGKFEYSSINDLVVVCHGDYNFLQFNPNNPSKSDSNLLSSQIDSLFAKFVTFHINRIDICACNCGNMDNGDCFAKCLVEKMDNVESVFAWKGRNYTLSPWLNYAMPNKFVDEGYQIGLYKFNKAIDGYIEIVYIGRYQFIIGG